LNKYPLGPDQAQATPLTLKAVGKLDPGDRHRLVGRGYNMAGPMYLPLQYN